MASRNYQKLTDRNVKWRFEARLPIVGKSENRIIATTEYYYNMVGKGDAVKNLNVFLSKMIIINGMR